MAELWRRIRFAFWAAVYARTGRLRAVKGMSEATDWGGDG
jgi:hypothetical protein